MNATTDADPLGPASALDAIERGLRFETSLRSRTEGLTWIVWGLVCAGTFLTFEATSPLFYGDGPLAQDVPFEDQEAPWWSGGLWVPWLVVGIAATHALWRSAALSSPGLASTRPRHWLVLCGWVAFVAAGWLLALLVFPDANVSTFPVLGIGTAWVLFGALDVYRGTPTGRRTTIAMGVVVFVAGVVLAAAVSPHAHDPSGAVAGHLGALVTGAVPIAGGLWQSLRG